MAARASGASLADDQGIEARGEGGRQVEVALADAAVVAPVAQPALGG